MKRSLCLVIILVFAFANSVVIEQTEFITLANMAKSYDRRGNEIYKVVKTFGCVDKIEIKVNSDTARDTMEKWRSFSSSNLVLISDKMYNLDGTETTDKDQLERNPSYTVFTYRPSVKQGTIQLVLAKVRYNPNDVDTLYGFSATINCPALFLEVDE